MKCLVIQHLAFEDLGIFKHVLTQHGFDIHYRQAGVDALLETEWIDSDLVIVLGGPLGVYETESYPWLVDEVAAIQRRLQRKQPILGICLGAQLMAKALGAKVYPGSEKEIGWSIISLTAAGKKTCLQSLEDKLVLHWHGDTFDLPAGATLLASTAITTHQAFSVGSHALALQFHPEVDGSLIEPWLIGHTGELKQTGISVNALRSISAKVAAEAAQAGKMMLTNWLKQLAQTN